MKVILTGATGYVGEGVLLSMLDDSRIEKVLSVGRRSCGVNHTKLTEYLVGDFLSLKEGDPHFEGYDVVFFIAGISSVGTPKDIYQVISHDIPVHFAKIMPNKDKMSFIYLSGGGTSENGRQNWQKVKSSTEKETQSMGFKHAFGWRPMMMTPYKGQKNRQLKAQKVSLIMYPLLRLLGMSCSMPEMVSAMYSVCTEGFHRPNIESADIIRIAKKARKS